MIDISQLITKPVQVYYLIMNSKPAFDYNKWQEINYSFQELAKPINVFYYLNIYQSVGLKYNWYDRLFLSEIELEGLINKPNTIVSEFKIGENFAGWAEFVCEPDFVEIQYFGLTKEYIGKGFGKLFLNLCVEKAWSFKPLRVQLNTCELDHKNALNVYKSLGFIEYKTQIELRKVSK